jgi:hypothetical protein
MVIRIDAQGIPFVTYVFVTLQPVTHYCSLVALQSPSNYM